MSDEPNVESYELSKEDRQKAMERLAKQRRRLSSGTQREAKKLAKLARYKIAGAWVQTGWREGGLATVLLLRNTGKDSFVLGGLIVDLSCLGIKDGFAKTDLSKARFEEFFADMREKMGLEPCEPVLAAKLVEEGMLLGLSLGFDVPDDAYPVLSLYRTLDASQCDEEIPLGKNGKPLYVSGPYDDVDSILAQLKRELGEGNFHFLAQAPPGLGF